MERLYIDKINLQQRDLMASLVENINIDWRDSALWGKARYNTLWCLIGCSIGDLAPLLFFNFQALNGPLCQ